MVTAGKPIESASLEGQGWALPDCDHDDFDPDCAKCVYYEERYQDECPDAGWSVPWDWG